MYCLSQEALEVLCSINDLVEYNINDREWSAWNVCIDIVLHFNKTKTNKDKYYELSLIDKYKITELLQESIETNSSPIFKVRLI